MSTVWTVYAVIFLALVFVAGLLALRGTAFDRLLALEVAGNLATLSLLVMAQAFERDVYFDLAVVTGAMSFVGTLYFVRFLESGL
jgi:multisubunit Na+/H+ antiporter MnhF subunit